jgi:hypothetical protein
LKYAETGEPVEIQRKGTTFKIICESPKSKLAKLREKKHPKAYQGDSNEIISMDWSSEWKPGHI